MKRAPLDLLNLIQSMGIQPRRHGPTLFADYEAERDVASRALSSVAAKPMIYTLTIKCVWGLYLAEPCERVVEINDTASLMDLHYLIQKAVAFDDDHHFQFFVGPNARNRKMAFDENSQREHGAAVMSAFELRRIWPLPKGMKLFYWFDFGDDWKFQINKARAVKSPEKRVRYPRVVRRIGPNPEQYPDAEW